MRLAQLKQEATAERLDALTVPESGAWLAAARADAMARVRSMGLPHARDEYWKYTRPGTLTQAEVTEAALYDNDEAPMFDEIERLKVVFVDGVFSAAESDDLTGEGLTIERLADAGQSDIHWAKELYGKLETKGQDPVERPLAALNSALATRCAYSCVWRRLKACEFGLSSPGHQVRRHFAPCGQTRAGREVHPAGKRPRCSAV